MFSSSPPVSPLRRNSLDAVLSHAWEAQVFTVTDAMATGMTRSTTIDLIEELVARRLVRELENARAAGEYQKGRPARRFELNAQRAAVVGVDAGRTHITTTVADLRGAPYGTATVALDLDVDQETAAERRAAIAVAVDRQLAACGKSRSDVLSICVGVPGPVDQFGRSPAHREGFWQRMNADVGEMFRAWSPFVRVENDALLAAVAENAIGAAVGCDNFVALLAGTRLGAGVMIDGRLLRGAHGGVGEMAAFDHVHGVTGAWGLGYRAAEWATDAAASGLFSPTSPLGSTPVEQIDARLVLGLAEQGDPDAQGIVGRVGEMLAKIVGVFGSLYDPERVVISGGVADGAEGILDAARRVLPDQLDLPAPELVASPLGIEVVSIGAVRHAVDEARLRVLELSEA